VIPSKKSPDTVESFAFTPFAGADWAVLTQNFSRCSEAMNDQPADDARQQAAKDHLWMHFTRHSTYDTHRVPTIVRGDGVHIWDSQGNKYIDGLAGLFVVQAGHGRTELAVHDVAEGGVSHAASVVIWLRNR